MPRFPALRPALLLAMLAAACAALPAAASALAPARWYAFAPFTDLSGYPPPDLGAFRSGAGVRHVTLGFVTAQGASACAPAWGGFAGYPAAGPGAYRRANIRAFRRRGGATVPSFGGQAGVELASTCPSAAALAGAYEKVIATYGATHVDFDIEGAALADRAANTRRARAIVRLQRAARRRWRRLRVAFTLPVRPTGLDADGRALLRNAVAHGVRVSVVNVMAMDYGADAAPDPGGRMGAYAIQAARALHRQLHRIYPRVGPARRWRMVGVTPMLGVNDLPSEVFTVADAEQLAGFARHRHLGLLAMWELSRDRPCPQPATTTQEHCSGVAAPRWAFARALGRFHG